MIWLLEYFRFLPDTYEGVSRVTKLCPLLRVGQQGCSQLPVLGLADMGILCPCQLVSLG